VDDSCNVYEFGSDGKGIGTPISGYCLDTTRKS
jgi:hypothetical protein